MAGESFAKTRGTRGTCRPPSGLCVLPVCAILMLVGCNQNPYVAPQQAAWPPPSDALQAQAQDELEHRLARLRRRKDKSRA